MSSASRRLLGLLLATAALGACSDDTGPQDTPITAQDAATIGAAAASTADLALVAIAPGVPDFSTGFLPFLAVGRRVPGLHLAPPDSLPNCPAAADATDTDGDGVPDDATWTFNAADCTRTDLEGNSSVVTGAVGISDPGLTPGYDLSIQALSARFYQSGDPDPALQLDLDGTWGLRGTSDALTLDQHYNFALTFDGHTTVLANTLDVAFDAAAGDIAWGVPLPDGTLSIDGQWQVTAADRAYQLVLNTLTPLAYDDACGGFVGGALQAFGDGGMVTVTWTACGVYTTEFVPD